MNGIRSLNPVDLGIFSCFKVSLKDTYGNVSGILHRTLMDLFRDWKLATYDLIEWSESKCSARIYVKEPGLINFVKDKFINILDSEPAYLEDRVSSYLGIENFFDALIDTAFARSGFSKVGRGGYLDPSDPGIYVRKRTIVEVAYDPSHNERYHAILFIDYSQSSRSTIADKLMEGLEIDDFKELKDKSELKEKVIELASSYIGRPVLTLVKRGSEYRHVYGEIVGMKQVFSCEEQLQNKAGGSITLYQLWAERFNDEPVRQFVGSRPSELEFPIFKIRLEGSQEPLSYPPSMLRVFEASERPDPSTRWDNIRSIINRIEGEIKQIYKKITGNTIEFRYIKKYFGSKDTGIKLNFYTEAERELKKNAVSLVYLSKDGREKQSSASPIFMFSKEYVPYAGKQELELPTIYPSILDEKSVNLFVEYVVRLFKRFNFGEITSFSLHKYTYNPANLSLSLNSLEKTLYEALSRSDRLKSLPLIIIPDNDEFYKSSKTTASTRGFHSQIVRLENFEKAVKSSSYLREAIESLIANICSGIYTEFLIQKKISEGEVAGPLTWILAKPADGEGKSMYVGLDISTKRGISGAAFIMLDPRGKLIDVKILQLKSETLQYQGYYDILRHMISEAEKQGLRRVVILRDGNPRSQNELYDCTEAFKRVTQDLGYEVSLDYVAVIKRANVRAFREETGDVKVNPVQGTYAYLYQMVDLGYRAHEILVVSSRPESGEEEDKGGTTRPIILRAYELQKEYNLESMKGIAEEYLALTRLNFWNLRTGASKLALPIKMADILSYMLSLGIPIRAGP